MEPEQSQALDPGSGVPAVARPVVQRAILAGGCFWGMQDLFRKQPGVISTRVGYTGGDVPHATYRNHGKHAEGIEIVFDPAVTNYRQILEYFFQIHDPTRKRSNGRALSYRSGIYYVDVSQRRIAEETIGDVEASGLWHGKVLTEVAPVGDFWEAEPEHQDYLEKWPGGYTCHFPRSDWVLPRRQDKTGHFTQPLSPHQDRTMMPDLSSFPITQRWPARHPDRLQLYAAPTPNGVKVSIMLEEIGLAYEPHLIDIANKETKDPAFVSLNPNGRIPAIIDPAGPEGQPVAIWESGAILLYLAEKTGQLIPSAPVKRYQTLSWVFFQMSAIGPMFGQLGFFLRGGGKDYEDKRPQQRFIDESMRLLGVLERQLEGRDWIVDDYSIADIATLGWVNALIGSYGASDILALDNYPNIQAWLGRGLARPAVQRGLHIPARPA